MIIYPSSLCYKIIVYSLSLLAAVFVFATYQ